MSKTITTVILLFIISMPAQSATILRIGVTELAKESELIFEGAVLSIDIESTSNGKIYSYVNFSVIDVLVGDQNIGPTLTLRFAGGRINDTNFDIGVRIPEINEKGIYFVERVRVGLVNPLLGWDQGHFLITNQGNVMAANAEPVISIEARSNKEGRSLSISQGLALGIVTGNKASRLKRQSPPMTVDQFKARIRTLAQ